MLYRRHSSSGKDQGFTLFEVMIVIVLLGIFAAAFFAFAQQSILGYFRLQQDASALNNLYVKSARMTRVLRGITGIQVAKDNELVVYAYFTPSDQYVSKLHYYIDSSGDTKVLKADMTPMTAMPPVGSPITSEKRTFTIMQDFYKQSSEPLFTYLDVTDQPIATPISNPQPIMAIKVNLAMHAAGDNTYNTTLRVTLRNKVQ